MNQRLQFNLNISSSEIIRLYKGQAQQLITTLDNGQRVQLPLINFRPFINDLGLHGRFEVEFSPEFKLISLTKLKNP